MKHVLKYGLVIVAAAAFIAYAVNQHLEFERSRQVQKNQLRLDKPWKCHQPISENDGAR